MNYKISPIILNSGSKNSNISDIFIAQTDAQKEDLAGKAFVLIEINKKGADTLKFIDFLINDFIANYYNNEKILLRERIKTLKIEHIFEAALAKTNKNVLEFIETEKIKLKPEMVNITIGVVYNTDIHFANTGSNKCLLIFKDLKNSQNSESAYKIADIASSKKLPVDNEQPVKFTKLFSNVISGQIPDSGYFIISNEVLPEYLSSKQMIDIITKLPPSGAAEQIKNTLSSVNAYVSFLGIIIKSSKISSPKILSDIILDKKQSSAIASNHEAQKSISDLNNTEEKTEKFLSPSGLINIKKYSKLFKEKLSNIFPSKDKLNRVSIHDKIVFQKKPSFASFEKIIGFFKNLLSAILGIILSFLKIFSSKEGIGRVVNNAKSGVKKPAQWFSGFKNWLVRLNTFHKVLIGVFIVLIIAFIVNLNIKDKENKRIAIEKNYDETVQQIEKKQNQVDANLLYSNEEGAKDSLNKIQELLNELPNESAEDKAKYTYLFEKHSKQLEKIQHIENIENPTVLANFSNLNSQANAENIIMANNKIYVGDSNQKTIYTLDLNDKAITAITDLNNTISNLNTPAIDNENNIYYIDEKITKLNTEADEISKLDINFTNDIKTIIDSDSYNNRLYLLSPTTNQIYRFNKNAGGFDSQYSWIQDSADLSQATDMTIDGSIFVLKSNGEVIKYFAGESEDFNIESIQPTFENADKIISLPDSNYLYIMESKNNRIVIFSDTGDFIVQYKSDKLLKIKDFLVDEKNKKIYILNENSIYEIDISSNI